MNRIELAQSEYEVIPITLEEANNFVKKHHRHHRPTVGHKFSIGLIIKNQRHKLIGVAIFIASLPLYVSIKQYPVVPPGSRVKIFTIHVPI